MKEGKKKTIATFFRESLAGLMDEMLKAEPSFVRCIKPNTTKSPSSFDHEYVLKQVCVHTTPSPSAHNSLCSFFSATDTP